MTQARKLYREIASLVDAAARCEERGNGEWRERHVERVNSLVRGHLPHGAGFDNGTKLVWEKSTGDKLVFSTHYHHMNESGMYDGWTQHDVIVTPSFVFGFSVRVTGRDRRRIKEYIAECFHYDLATRIDAEGRRVDESQGAPA